MLDNQKQSLLSKENTDHSGAVAKAISTYNPYNQDFNSLKKDTEILKLQKIDCLVKALGTMVMIPEYDSDPVNIGVKHFKGTIQQPILKDSNRDKALEKITKLIESL